MTLPSTAAIAPIVLLALSNVFMTFAWYGHLKFTDKPLWIVVLASWGIAFFEYCLAVPANRVGAGVYSAAELKTMQEVITLVVFRRLLGLVSRPGADAQSRGRVRVHRARSVLHFQGAAVMDAVTCGTVGRTADI